MSLAYGSVLFVHSYLRWVVLLLAVAVVARSFAGWRAARVWSSADERVHHGFVWSMRIQFVLGLLLYVVLSPISGAFFAHPGASMKVGELRFFGLEHVSVMLIAVAIADIGRARSKRLSVPRLRQRRVFITTLVSLLLMLAGIPWPFMPTKRPLFRSPSGALATQAHTPPALRCPPVYTLRCASCHGPRGKGDGVLAASLETRPRSFVDASWLDSRSDADLRNIIRDGGAKHGLSPLMPPHTNLDDAQIDALVICIRAFR